MPSAKTTCENVDQVKRNIKVRDDVEETWELVDTVAADSLHEKRFWDLFCEEYDRRFPVEIPPSTIKPMTDDESRDFDNQVMQFGGWEGHEIRQVPLGYLLWLDEQPDFRQQLRRYLASERIQREQ